MSDTKACGRIEREPAGRSGEWVGERIGKEDQQKQSVYEKSLNETLCFIVYN